MARFYHLATVKLGDSPAKEPMSADCFVCIENKLFYYEVSRIDRDLFSSWVNENFSWSGQPGEFHIHWITTKEG